MDPLNRRPNNRTQNRGSSRAAQKRSPIIDGIASTTGKTVTTKGSENGASSSIGILQRNVPISGRASELIRSDAATAKQDGGFYIHKRGGDALPALKVNKRNRSIEQREIVGISGKKQMKTITAREAVPQAMASGAEDTDNDDQVDTSILLSDRNSLNNFSYYGRRGLRDSSPNVSDAASLHYNQSAQKNLNLNIQLPAAFGANQNLNSSGAKLVMMRKGSQGLHPTKGKGPFLMTEGNLENVSNSVAGLYGRKSNPRGYMMEEQMNDNLMKAFQPMLSTDRTLKQQQRLLTQDAMRINSVSDFSESVNGPQSHSVNHAQYFQKAKQIAQKRSALGKASQQSMANQDIMPALATSVVMRSSTEAQTQRLGADKNLIGAKAQNIMLKNSLNVLQKKYKTGAAKVLPPKLPPRATISPVINKSLKAPQPNMTPGKDNSYFLPQPKTEMIDRRSVIRKDKRLILEAPPIEGRMTTLPVDVSRQSRNLKHSESMGSVHSTARAEMNKRKCTSCLKKGGCVDHSNADSIEQRVQHFNKNFLTSGFCRAHKNKDCDLCTFGGSSKGSQLSSLGSPQHLKSRSVLRVDRLALLKQEISKKKAKNLASSATRQQKLDLSKNESMSSLPRENSQSTPGPSPNKKAGKSKGNLLGLRGQLHGFSKKGNRPIIATVKAPDDHSSSKPLSIHRAVSEFGTLNKKSPGKKVAPKVAAIPNFSRVFSAKPNTQQRDDISRRLLQNESMHGDMLQDDVLKLAKEWEGDVSDPEFWKRKENQNDQLRDSRRSLVQGQEVRNQQKNLLQRQSEVFKQMRETDDQFNSARNSSVNFHQTDYNQARKSSAQQMEEPMIQTEIDANDMTILDNPFMAATMANNRRLFQDPSQAVLTDYDIADEVTQKFGSSIRQNQVGVRDASIEERIGEESNIEDLKRQLEKQIKESKATRTINNAGTTQDSRMGASQITGTFAAYSDKQNTPEKRSLTSAKEVASPRQAKENTKGKDSEEAESFDFDDEKQKSQVLKDLELGGIEQDEVKLPAQNERKSRQRKKRKRKATVTGTNISDTYLSEHSNEDEDEKRQKEIQLKTMANVKDFDEYLEAQTQKEIDRLSQERQSRNGQLSPREDFTIPENGVLKLPQDDQSEGSTRLRNNRTQKIIRNSLDLEKHKAGDADGDNKPSLAETIQEQLETSRRPKTRGDPITEGLQNEVGELPTDKNQEKEQSQGSKQQASSSNAANARRNTFSARRMTQDQSSGANTAEKNPDSRNDMASLSEKRFKGAAAPVPFGASMVVPSEKNFRSNAQMTVFESSLKDDDLMISTSLVDPLESRNLQIKKLDSSEKFNKGNKMPFSTQDIIGGLVIKEEEDPSLQSVSPLTDVSRSKKSVRIAAEQSEQEPKTIAPKKGLPPKSPLPTRSANKPPKQSRLPQQVAQPLETNKTASFADYQATQEIIEENPAQKVDGRVRTSAVLDFLAYEDSDEDGLPAPGVPPPMRQPTFDEPTNRDNEIEKGVPQPENGLASPSDMVKMKQKSLPDNSIIQSTPTGIDALQKSLMDMPPQKKSVPNIAKTPTLNLNAVKREGLQLVDLPSRQTETPVPKLPVTAGGVTEEPSVNEQINRIPYDQSNDGMSASYYRQHDQWLAGNPINSVTTRRKSTPRLPPVQENTRYQKLPPPSRELKTSGRRKESIAEQAPTQTSAPSISQEMKEEPGRKTTTPRATSRTSKEENPQKSQPSLRRQPSVIRQDAFFERHKGMLDEKVNKSVIKRRDTSVDRAASQNRLYNQETIASILKRNSELGFDPAKKKPPVMPLKRLTTKKKSKRPRTPSESSEEPPEEPFEQSPRVLQLPIEASVPYQESAPTTMPLPMRLPNDPPSEPSAFIMPNIYCPPDPETPFNYDPEPREDDLNLYSAPTEPPVMYLLPEPENTLTLPEAPQLNTEEFMSEKLEECEGIQCVAEPDHDDEPALKYPRQERPMMLPPTLPSKFEPPTGMPAEEPELDLGSTDQMPLPTDPELNALSKEGQPKRTHEMSIQCNDVEEETKGELTRREMAALQSDDDIFSMHSCAGTINKVSVGIQTNAAHFRKIELSPAFQQKQQERVESTDWALSPIYDDIHFAKDKKAGRRHASMATQTRVENCGNQVSHEQILEEVQKPKLSQIACEYNVDQLKRKLAGKDQIEEDKLCELYTLGLSTLKSLMLGLRLEKEWQTQTSQQYLPPEESTDFTDVQETIKLLIRNKKMYEAKTLIQRLLKLIVERDSYVEQAQTIDNDQVCGPQPLISLESNTQIKRLSTRISSLINTLQEEHRIFRRPFILHGVEYLEQMLQEGSNLDDLLAQKSDSVEEAKQQRGGN